MMTATNIDELFNVETTFGAAACDGALFDGRFVAVAARWTAVLSFITVEFESSAWIDQWRLPVTQLLVKF